MKKFKRVRPEDFNVELLLLAAREGRLYVDESTKAASKEEIISEVRAYVGRIKDFVTPEFRPMVNELWEQIFSCDDFITFLTPGKKVRLCLEFDKYNVMRIIGVLREKGVYQQYSDYKFHALLEQTDKDSSYRKYLGKGIENNQHRLLVKLRQIVAKYEHGTTLTFR